MDNFFLKAEQLALKNLYLLNNNSLKAILFSVDESLLPHFKNTVKSIYMDKSWKGEDDVDIIGLLIKYSNEDDKIVWDAVLAAMANGYSEQLFYRVKTKNEDEDLDKINIADVVPEFTFDTIATSIAANLTTFLSLQPADKQTENASA